MNRDQLYNWIKNSEEKYLAIYDRDESISIESELHNYKSYLIQSMRDNFSLQKQIVDLQEKLESLTKL